ncbi:SDR family oxidoreductase [Okeania sp. KiyG1]|uniref:SDR family NAD(P)-dependent oxidoreductase n=1 Tax=Okeania sp. KiyG1 TaxID=2720165 RepID=UPI00192334C7|nr:SDR family NAD(P)-dependent oxidoreductase [Okeania sp. KiyG1]GGA41346.1 short-chain dehydrogenase [Okeania sp. KiyG1]
MTELNNATVVLTGATGGFGQELTRQLLQAGSHLVLSDIKQDSLDEQASKITSEITTGKIISCIESDLSHPEGCLNLYDRVKALDIPIDILINNAGIALFGRMDEVPSDKWERLMQVNLLSPMRLSSLFAAGMIERKKGHIVNISSLSGWIAAGGMAHYSSSKFGLRGFSEGLFNEVKSHNVKVTVVYPFFSRTPILLSERYGTLAQGKEGFPEHLATNPAKVMERTIKAIVRNQLHVFPDQPAQILHIFKQYFPGLVDWISDRLISNQKTI